MGREPASPPGGGEGNGVFRWEAEAVRGDAHHRRASSHPYLPLPHPPPRCSSARLPLLAWGVNLPAHLVVVKGTEYFDGKQKRYVEMPITDVPVCTSTLAWGVNLPAHLVVVKGTGYFEGKQKWLVEMPITDMPCCYPLVPHLPCHPLSLPHSSQVLVCTSTLAWGVNLPAHLVVVKGTEYFDGKQKRYVEMPITDVLQMMGRAGRPQFDNEAKAVILVHEPKKSFYKKFLYEPFPVESSLHLVLHDHLNAEVAGGSIASVQDAMDYLTWTFFFRRLLCNPSFYGLSDTSAESVNVFLSDLVSRTLSDLDAAGCIALQEDGSVDPLPPGLIASQYYLHFTTAALFTANLTSPSAAAAITLETVLHVLCGAAEFDELPVRHNECSDMLSDVVPFGTCCVGSAQLFLSSFRCPLDTLPISLLLALPIPLFSHPLQEFVNAELAKHVRWKVDHRTYDDPHTKTNLLLQAHFARLAMPMSDYETDLKSVLDQTMRVLQAMIDTAATAGRLQPSLLTMRLTQMVIQAVWCDLGSPIAMLPHVTPSLEDALSAARLASLSALLSASPHHLRQLLSSHLSPAARADFLQQFLTSFALPSSTPTAPTFPPFFCLFLPSPTRTLSPSLSCPPLSSNPLALVSPGSGDAAASVHALGMLPRVSMSVSLLAQLMGRRHPIPPLEMSQKPCSYLPSLPLFLPGSGDAASSVHALGMLPRVSMSVSLLAHLMGRSHLIPPLETSQKPCSYLPSLPLFLPGSGDAAASVHVKEEGWWVVVAAADSPTLLALKRVSFTHRLTTRLHVPELLSSVKQLSVHLISDCYVGLDQQVTVPTNAAAVTTRGAIGQYVINNVGFVTAAAAAAAKEKGNVPGGGEGVIEGRQDGVNSSGGAGGAAGGVGSSEGGAAEDEEEDEFFEAEG
ncbi:unnamed protein product [Closterium sp. NIES-54]